MSARKVTFEQESALVSFASVWGRTWKSKLRDLWMKGTASDGGAMSDSVLYRLRNTHGPSWLADYRLPKSQRPAVISGAMGATEDAA